MIGQFTIVMNAKVSSVLKFVVHVANIIFQYNICFIIIFVLQHLFQKTNAVNYFLLLS